jgi:regulator of sigma E protease
MAIVAAGPAANFVFAILVLAVLFATAGRPFTPAEVGFVREDGPAAAAGLQVDDRIVEVDGQPIASFEELQDLVRDSAGQTLSIAVVRDGEEIVLSITPELSEVTDRFGNEHRMGLIGVGRAGMEFRKSNPATAVFEATGETWRITTMTLDALWQMVVGARGTEDLGGPLRIAQISGQVAQEGLVPTLWLMAVLSINLGLINLFPIPMLDGGHLALYSIEAACGRPLTERSQEWAFRVGLALVLSLMVFATWNDLVHLRVVDFFAGLVS